MKTRSTVLVTAGALAIGCASFGSAEGRRLFAHNPMAPIVGRWATTKTCSGVVQALKRVHLLRLAPSVVGDCRGAKPQRHSHFFTRDGFFGSLDQTGQQVDDELPLSDRKCRSRQGPLAAPVITRGTPPGACRSASVQYRRVGGCRRLQRAHLGTGPVQAMLRGSLAHQVPYLSLTTRRHLRRREAK